MAFLNLTRDLFETVTINVTPRKEFISGSKTGVTGSVYVSPVRSDALKEVRTFTEIENDPFDDASEALEEIIDDIQGSFESTNITAELEDLFTHVENGIFDLKSQKKINIQRIEQPIEFATGSVIKRYIQKNLMPSYRHQYHQSGYYYTNYHTLNFVAEGGFNTKSVLIYPNVENNEYVTSSNKAITTQFWINPRYKNEKPDKHFHAGTILHVSGSIALSLISGSRKDNNGLVESYKILCQIEDTSKIVPDKINFQSRVSPNNYWITSSFELDYNHWHHVTFRWSSTANNQNAELIVDKNKTSVEFAPSSSEIIATGTKAIFLGNFFDGHKDNPGRFFNEDARDNEGVVLISNDPFTGNNAFNNPLNAEIHDVRIYNTYLTDQDILSGSGPEEKDYKEKNLSFFVPPFFYPESTKRSVIYDGTFKVSTSSYTPINTLFAFSKNGKEINLENFTKDMVKGYQPRLFHLTSSVSTGITSNNVDEYAFSTGSITKRNMTILPNDNGLFKPNYYAIDNLSTGSLDHHFTGGSLGDSINYDFVKIENLALNETTFEGIDLAKSIKDALFNVLPTDTTIIDDDIKELIISNTFDGESELLAILEDLKDNSSNHISIFNISNLFYGNRIHPGSFELFENEMSGSSGKIKINLKDNERGSLYRADCLTDHAVWNSVGNIFYDEGLVIIKSPHLPLYGKDKFTTKFKGEQEIHSMVIDIPAERGLFNSSSNSNFKVIPKSDSINDANTKTIAVSSVNIHDENFNIIMRANFAQPLLKSNEDEFVVRLKMDF